MRVSTSMIFNSGTAGMQNRQSDLYKVQNQLNTGRRILSPEDDPIGASEVLQVLQSKNVNKQFLDNQADAQSKLGYLESTLGGIGNELQNIHERVIQAGNATYDSAQRNMIAEELKRRMENLVGLANTQDGAGNYIFSGYQTNTKPFEYTGNTAPFNLLTGNASTYIKYVGDSGRQTFQVSASKDMAVSESGSDVFFLKTKDSLGVTQPASVFDSIQNMIGILDGTEAYDSTKYAEALEGISASMDHVSTVRASVGARMQSLESLSTNGEDAGILYDTRLSELQDLDYAEAISRFANYKMQLEATQLSFKQTSQLSLFNIL